MRSVRMGPEGSGWPGPLGRVGIWTSALDNLPVPKALRAALELEALGYGALWFGESLGRESFVNASLLLSATSRLVVATGIASIYARDPVAANAGSRVLEGVFAGRFVLGLGVTHGPLVEYRGHSYGPPLVAVREYLRAMDGAPFAAAGGERAAPRVLAALGPKMLDLARDAADGAHTYLVTPEHTAIARARLGEGPLLAVEQAVVLTRNREEALGRAHSHIRPYLRLPNYRRSCLRQGFSEEDLSGDSERLAEALVAWGDEASIKARVDAHLEAGADHVCLQVLSGPREINQLRIAWKRLAAALLV